MGGPPTSPSTTSTTKPPISPTVKQPPVSPASSSSSKPPVSPAARRKSSTPGGRQQLPPESAVSSSGKSVASPSSKSLASTESAPLPARYAIGEDFRVKVRLVALSGIMTLPLAPTTPKKTTNQKKKNWRTPSTGENETPVTACVSFVVNNAPVEAKVKGAKKEGQKGRYSVRRMARVPSKPIYQTVIPTSPTSTLGGAIRHVARWGGQYSYPSVPSSVPSSPATPQRASSNAGSDRNERSSGPKFSSPSTVYLSTRLAREEGMTLQPQETFDASQQDAGVTTAEDRNDNNPSSAQDEIRQQDDLVTEEFSPELIRIYVGVSRKEEHIPLGVATLVISGAPLEGQAMDLPVQQMDAGTTVSGEADEGYSVSVPEYPATSPSNAQGSMAHKKKRSLFRRILATVKHSDADTQTSAGAFHGDNQRYGMAHNAVLRICVDLQPMKDGEHFKQVPHVLSIDSADFDNSVNGDADDDDVIVDEDDEDEATYDQERRIMVVTAMPDEAAIAAGRDLDESIEVMTGDIGVTVISSPLASIVSAQSDVPSIVVTDVPVQRRRKATSGSDGGNSSRGKLREVSMGKTYSAPAASEMLLSAGTTPTAKNLEKNPKLPSSDNGPDREKSVAATAGDKTFVADSIFFEMAHGSMEEERSAIARGVARRRRSDEVEDNRDEDENDHDEEEDDDEEEEEDAGYTVEGTAEDYTLGDDTLTLGDGTLTLGDGQRTVRADSNESDSSEVTGEASVGQDTIDSLNKAKDTLRRYAHRTGIKVEDLIESEGVTVIKEEEDEDDEEDDDYTESYRTYEDGSTTYRTRTFDDGSTLVSQLDATYQASRQNTYDLSTIANSPKKSF